MSGQERRKIIIETIRKSEKPVSGSKLAADLEVSRQVIVQDIALLRTAGYDIISTNRGYIIKESDAGEYRVFKVEHTDEEIEDELFTIVDLGGKVLDVFVSHRTYGVIKAQLNMSSRKNVLDFMEEIRTGVSSPLKNVTNGYHYHTISADSTETLDLIQDALQDKGYLLEMDEWDLSYLADSAR